MSKLLFSFLILSFSSFQPHFEWSVSWLSENTIYSRLNLDSIYSQIYICHFMDFVLFTDAIIWKHYLYGGRKHEQIWKAINFCKMYMSFVQRNKLYIIDRIGIWMYFSTTKLLKIQLVKTSINNGGIKREQEQQEQQQQH